MARIIEGGLTGDGRYGVVVSRFNSRITDALLTGCLDGLVRSGVADDAITVVRVPGALEMSVVAARMAASGDYDALIALGAVIRGATPHFDMVAGEVSKGLSQVSLQHGLPVINAVLTTDTIEQAVERAGTKAGNKGFDAARGAIEMVNLLRVLG